MKQTTQNRPRIAYDDEGVGGTTFLLLPGWCGSRAVFASLVPLLARDARVLALDWRGHGASDAPDRDFTGEDNVEDALAVISTSGAEAVVPVAAAHAGWVAFALLSRLGARRVPKVALLDWLVLDPPAPFLGALAALQDPASTEAVRDKLFEMWLGGSSNGAVARFLREDMALFPKEMWARGGREIARSYAAHGSPLAAFAALGADVPILHLYAQPRDDAYLEAQRTFAAAHPWFRVRRIDGATHFPSLESAEVVARSLLEL